MSEAPERIFVKLSTAASNWLHTPSLNRTPRIEYLRADLYAAQAAEIAALQAKVEKLTGALQLVDGSAVDTYHNKRGRRCTLEDGNGEKSWIIPDDTIAHVRDALTPEGE